MAANEEDETNKESEYDEKFEKLYNLNMGISEEKDSEEEETEKTPAKTSQPTPKSVSQSTPTSTPSVTSLLNGNEQQKLEHRMTIRLTDKDHQKLTEIASKSGKSKAEILRMGLDILVKQLEQLENQ